MSVWRGFAWLVPASCLTGLGGFILLAGLLRLGWMRHGTAAGDLRFLHLDWVLRPDLPYWLPHLINLGATLLGLALALSGMLIAILSVKRMLQ